MGFGVLFFESGPMFALSVSFLKSDDVTVVEEISNGFFLAFRRVSGRPSAVRRSLAFHVANVSDGASLGRIRFVSSLSVGVLSGGWWLGGALVG